MDVKGPKNLVLNDDPKSCAFMFGVVPIISGMNNLSRIFLLTHYALFQPEGPIR